MVLLLHWSLLNYAAVVKILKKHGKRRNAIGCGRQTLTHPHLLCGGLKHTQQLLSSGSSRFSIAWHMIDGCANPEPPTRMLTLSLCVCPSCVNLLADKQSGLLLRAPYLANVLQQVCGGVVAARGACLSTIAAGTAAVPRATCAGLMCVGMCTQLSSLP